MKKLDHLGGGPLVMVSAADAPDRSLSYSVLAAIAGVLAALGLLIVVVGSVGQGIIERQCEHNGGVLVRGVAGQLCIRKDAVIGGQR
jgi:hypothetical protein